MTVRVSQRQPWPRAVIVMALLALGAGLSGCADMSDSMTSAFADPAKYDLYECKQLEAERKSLATRAAELQGLMAKAETGTAGVVVAELAYRNDYISVRGQARLADEVWRRNKCRPSRDSRPSRQTPKPGTLRYRPAARSIKAPATGPKVAELCHPPHTRQSKIQSCRASMRFAPIALIERSRANAIGPVRW
jgi:hypothetical protein